MGLIHSEHCGFLELKKDPDYSVLKELSDKLALNLISISFDGSVDTSTLREILKSENNSLGCRTKKERIVVVTGAGTSFNANRNIPLGVDGPNSLLEEQENKCIKELVDDEIERLSQVYRLKGEEFETVLLAMSKYVKDIYGQLQKKYNFRYYPNQFYELVAHMLKNRFIDAVINFNFDELLDQAIDDEMNKSEYKKIITDGDVPNSFSDVITGDRLKIPLYIKPHGTVSHKTSLKFTREDYFNVPSDIYNFMGDLLSGATNTDDILPVNVLVFGFKMQSYEFNNLLKKNLPQKSTIYVFCDDKSKDIIESEIGEELEHRSETSKEVFIKYIQRPDVGLKSTNMILCTLYRMIGNVFNEEYKPRGIKRHLLISQLFPETEEKNLEERDLLYFEDRTYVELSLLVAKSFGFVGLTQMTNERVGIYYNLYRSLAGKEKNIGIKTLFDFCEDLGLQSYGYGREFYTLKKPSTKKYSSVTMRADEFQKDFLGSGRTRCLIRTVKEKISERTNSIINDPEVYNLYQDTLVELFNAEDVEISPAYDNIHDNLFSNPTVINTKLAFDFYTKKQFKENLDTWDVLLAIAETGEWVTKKTNYKGKQKVCLVIADDSHIESLKSLKGNNVTIKKLSWWLHNQHMSIYLEKKEGKKTPKKISLSDWGEFYTPTYVVYFPRRLRNILINPVVLEEDRDRELAMEIYFAYYKKAKNDGSIKVITRKGIKKTKIRLK